MFDAVFEPGQMTAQDHLDFLLGMMSGSEKNDGW